MKTRDSQIDTLKGVLIICVHIGHQWIPVGYDDMMQQINNFIYLFHMPLFYLLSIIFVKTFSKDYLFDRFKRLMIPYFLWYFILLYIIPIISSSQPSLDLIQDLKTLIFGSQQFLSQRHLYIVPLWFLISLFSLNILISIFKTDIKQFKILKNILLLISIFIIFNVSLIRETIHKYILGGIDIALYFLPMFIGISYLYKNISNKKNNILALFVGILLALISGHLLYLNMDTNPNYFMHRIDVSQFLLPEGFLYIVYSIFIISLFYILRFLPANKYFSYLGKHTFLIYILNIPIYCCLYNYTSSLLNFMNYKLAFPLIFVINTFFCFIIPILLNKLLCTLKTIGVKQ